jgi:CCR4-NOT transcriptional regulation complex NOT5 subunit
MSKLKLEHGVSRIRHAKLQSSIDQTIADDIELMAEWSNNETNFVVNELLRFALAQEEEFQRYKASSSATTARTASNTKPGLTAIESTTEAAAKPDAAAARA